MARTFVSTVFSVVPSRSALHIGLDLCSASRTVQHCSTKMHRAWRSCRLRRHYSDAANPRLRQNLFSTRDIPQNILDVSPSDPNPLYSLSKLDLVSLRPHELRHLLSLPASSAKEGERFCLVVLEIVHENLFKDTALASRHVSAIADSELRRTVFDCLRDFYANDKLRMALVLFMEDPTSSATVRAVLDSFEHILIQSESPPKEKARVMLNFLKKLAAAGKVNPNTILLPLRYLTPLVENLTSLQKRDLYGCLVHLNIRFKTYSQLDTLKNSLLRGSLLDKYVASTGALDPVWHDANNCDFSEEHREKMICFFTLPELVFFAESHIQRKDVIFANLYLDLLVTKFERVGDPKRLQVLLDVILQHSMAFTGPQDCIKYLRYMLDANLEITPATLLKVLKRFRADSCADEALTLVNFLHNEKLLHNQRAVLANEIMLVITDKFSQHPQIAVGYFAALFDFGTDYGLEILKELQLLDLVYGLGAVDTDFSIVQKADIHEDLKTSQLTHNILREMYVITLRNLPQIQSTNPVLIKQLYQSYLRQIESAKESEDVKSIFHPSKIDESVITVFLDYLLRTDPHAKDSFDLNSSDANYETAKWIVLDFLSKIKLDVKARKAYMMELVISSAVFKHRDISFAASMIKHARDEGVAPTFNQIYPFIIYHYQRREHEQALQWYNLLVLSGVRAKTTAATRLFAIAKELGWPVKGTMYKATSQKRNKRAREELAKLSSDPLSIFQTSPDVAESKSETNLLNDLGEILHTVAMKKSAENEALEED